MKRDSRRRDTGQALTEYVVLTMMIAGLAVMVNKFMPRLLAQIEKPIRKDLRQAYKYGDPKACGFDDDGEPCTGMPSRHPRYDIGGDNFRLFGRGKR